MSFSPKLLEAYRAASRDDWKSEELYAIYKEQVSIELGSKAKDPLEQLNLLVRLARKAFEDPVFLKEHEERFKTRVPDPEDEVIDELVETLLDSQEEEEPLEVPIPELILEVKGEEKEEKSPKDLTPND